MSSKLPDGMVSAEEFAADLLCDLDDGSIYAEGVLRDDEITPDGAVGERKAASWRIAARDSQWAAKLAEVEKELERESQCNRAYYEAIVALRDEASALKESYDRTRIALAASLARERELREALGDAVYGLGHTAVDGSLCGFYQGKITTLLSRPPGDMTALREVVTKTCAEAGREAARIAVIYEVAWGRSMPDDPTDSPFRDLASTAILDCLCDPDDPDTVRIVARVLKEPTP